MRVFINIIGPEHKRIQGLLFNITLYIKSQLDVVACILMYYKVLLGYIGFYFITYMRNNKNQ